MPAPVWRGGFARRALLIGGAVGSCLGVLAWLDSGSAIGGLVVMIVVGMSYGTWMARRMNRYWPQAQTLSGDDRVAVVRAVRRGDLPVDAAAGAQYARALADAARDARPLRPLLALVLVVALGTAVWDAVYGSWGSAVASAIYLAALVIELFWWPRRRTQLLIRARSLAS